MAPSVLLCLAHLGKLRIHVAGGGVPECGLESHHPLPRSGSPAIAWWVEVGVLEGVVWAGGQLF